MIKKLYEVRSRNRLFFGLAFAITALMILYTVMSIVYMPDAVTYTNVFGITSENVSKTTLLIWPAVSLLTCIAFLYDIKRGKTFASFENNKELAKKAMDTKKTFDSVMCFLFALALAFFQEYELGSAKNIGSFSIYVSYLAIAAIVIYSIYFVVKIIRLK